MISSTLMWPGFPADQVQDAFVDAYVETTRHGAGRLDHRLTLKATRAGSEVWTKEITFEVDAPFDVPDLTNVDPFVIASLFPVMEIGGTFRVHGTVSRALIRNVLDFQSAWFMGAPHYCRMFNLEVEDIEDSAVAADGAEPNAMLSFTGGIDAMLALCRNASGDAGPAGHKLGATMMIHGMRTGRGELDPAPLIDDLRRISGEWGLPMAVVDTNITDVVLRGEMSHGTWLAACLMLFSGRFDVGIIGSTKMWFTRGWELYGSHPLLDPLLSGGRMTIRNDEGLYHRAEKAEMLTRYPSALKDLRVCLAPYRADRNCCRCEKCVRTMLCFVACGHPIPPAFPHGLRLQDIKLYRGRRAGLQWIPGILASAERNGNSDLPEIRELRRQFRIKRLKVGAKVWSKALLKGRTPEKWYIFDTT